MFRRQALVGFRPLGRSTWSRYGARRYNATQSSAPKSSGSTTALWLAGGAALVGAGGYFYTQSSGPPAPKTITNPTKKDYEDVYRSVAKLLESEKSQEYDDGSFGPVVLRLAWHCSGTYDKETNTGGSSGATMRFAPESDHGANAGLHVAREILEPIREQHPWITISDLWTLAGVCAVQQMALGNMQVPWRPGREDKAAAYTSPDGRLPDGSRDQKHLRDIFYRLGFNDQQIVILSGAHALGRCHTDRSGFDGPWSFSPTVFTNDYFKLLSDEKWSWRKWDGPKQFIDNGTSSLMMLPTDMALMKDNEFKKWVKKYAQDESLFFKDFASVFSQLLELGVTFKENTPQWTFDYLETP